MNGHTKLLSVKKEYISLTERKPGCHEILVIPTTELEFRLLANRQDTGESVEQLREFLDFHDA